MAIHTFNLAQEPFRLIQIGSKIIESRLFDEKRQLIQVGDSIFFLNRQDPKQQITAQVTRLVRFPNFTALFQSTNSKNFGGSSVASLLKQIYQFYSIVDENTYGVIGIYFEVGTLVKES